MGPKVRGFDMHERLDLDGTSYARLTDHKKVAAAVVFVHGFRGCPEKTWIQFQTLVDEKDHVVPWWARYDAFFYGYDSKAQIGPNAASLLSFVCNVYPVPKWRELGTDGDLAPRKYKTLILVGHSEGGVLIRSAILRRVQDLENRPFANTEFEPDCILNANLRLFAPACWGMLVSGYPSLLLGMPVLGSWVESHLNKSPAYQQLASTDPLLNNYRERTVAKAKEYPSTRGFRARNLFPVKDDCVTAEALETDPPAEYEKKQSHRSICKPTPRYLRPLTFVRDDEYDVAIAI
jgi:hypothetical protein